MAALAQILARREQRQAEQLRLLRLGHPVVSLTIVSPGPDKDDETARHACAVAVDALDEALRARGWRAPARHAVTANTGPEHLVAVDAPPAELKRALVALEDDTPLGRLWDLDVLTGPGPDGLPIVLGRRAIGHGPRRCLVCAEAAAACGRSARHPLPLVRAAREALAARRCVSRIRVPGSTGHAASSEVSLQAARAADLGVQALLAEARLTPKPGLVDSASNGAHDDMDLALLERSAHALRPWFAACWLAGAARPGQVGPLVDLGVAAEAALGAVTGGVNTHRGALFAIGLVMGALGADSVAQIGVRTAAPHPVGDRTLPRVRARVADLAAPLLTDWLAAQGSAHDGGRVPGDVDPAPSHGAAALRAIGVTGARGEAASGFATVADVGLPAYRARLARTGDIDDALLWALVALMAANADTNLVHRGGPEGLAYAQEWARDLMADGPGPAGLLAAMAAAEDGFVARRLSPGGSADLLALTWLFDRLEPDAAES